MSKKKTEEILKFVSDFLMTNTSIDVYEVIKFEGKLRKVIEK